MAKLRQVLLNKIISTEGVFQHKYTMAYNTLIAVMKIEEKEKAKDRLPSSFFDKVKGIQSRYSNIDGIVSGVPLLILEQYFFLNSKDLGKFLWFEYNKIEIELKIYELYLMLESFFIEIFEIACEIMDYYNIEMKLKSNKDNSLDTTIETI